MKKKTSHFRTAALFAFGFILGIWGASFLPSYSQNMTAALQMGMERAKIVNPNTYGPAYLRPYMKSRYDRDDAGVPGYVRSVSPNTERPYTIMKRQSDISTVLRKRQQQKTNNSFVREGNVRMPSNSVIPEENLQDGDGVVVKPLIPALEMPEFTDEELAMAQEMAEVLFGKDFLPEVSRRGLDIIDNSRLDTVLTPEEFDLLRGIYADFETFSWMRNIDIEALMIIQEKIMNAENVEELMDQEKSAELAAFVMSRVETLLDELFGEGFTDELYAKWGEFYASVDFGDLLTEEEKAVVDGLVEDMLQRNYGRVYTAEEQQILWELSDRMDTLEAEDIEGQLTYDESIGEEIMVLFVEGMENLESSEKWQEIQEAFLRHILENMEDMEFELDEVPEESSETLE